MIFLILLLILLSSIKSEDLNEKWSMINRFYGFRFESSHISASEVKHEADGRLCFGWAQQTVNNHVVGEIRCKKDVGMEFVGWMRERDSDILIKVF